MARKKKVIPYLKGTRPSTMNWSAELDDVNSVMKLLHLRKPRKRRRRRRRRRRGRKKKVQI